MPKTNTSAINKILKDSFRKSETQHSSIRGYNPETSGYSVRNEVRIDWVGPRGNKMRKTPTGRVIVDWSVGSAGYTSYESQLPRILEKLVSVGYVANLQDDKIIVEYSI